MGDSQASEMEWNEPFFRDCFDNVDKVVTWVSRKGNPFARHQTIAQDFITEKKIDCDVAMVKSVETRFVSQVSMTERVLQQKKVFKALPKDQDIRPALACPYLASPQGRTDVLFCIGMRS
jgi:hypothetical protein